MPSCGSFMGTAAEPTTGVEHLHDFAAIWLLRTLQSVRPCLAFRARGPTGARPEKATDLQHSHPRLSI